MKLTKKIKPKIPRRLKKALTMSRPYWCCDYECSDENGEGKKKRIWMQIK